MVSPVILPSSIDRIVVIFAVKATIHRIPSNITAKGRIALPVLESTKHVLIVLPGSNPLFIVRTILSCFMDKTVFRRCWTRSTRPILSNHAIADGGLIFFHFCAQSLRFSPIFAVYQLIYNYIFWKSLSRQLQQAAVLKTIQGMFVFY